MRVAVLLLLISALSLLPISCGGGLSNITGLQPGPGTSGNANVSTDEQAVINMHNSTRSALGLAPLTVNAQLCQIAQNQADYQLSINTMTHYDAQGGDIGDRAIAVGYAVGSYIVGENVAYGMNVSISAIYDGWLNSPPHYANITDSRFSEIGIGLASNGVTQYWCATFGDT